MNINKTQERLSQISGTPIAELPATAEQLQSMCDDAGIEPVGDTDPDENADDKQTSGGD